MDKQPDNALRDRISQVFDNYEDTPADAGWLLLRERFPQKSKNRPVVWWLAAASVLIAGLGFWLFIPQKKQQTLSYKPKQEINGSSAQSYKPSGKVDNDLIASIPGSTTVMQSQTSNEYNRPEIFYPEVAANPTTANEHALTVDADITALNTAGKITQKDGLLNTPAKSRPTDRDDLVASTAVNDSTAEAAATLAAATKAKTMQDLLNADNAKIAANNTINKTAQASYRSVVLSAYAATYFNYAKGSNNQVNIGGGISSDFRVSNHLKFSTGLYVAQNTLSYTNTSIPQAVNTSALAIVNSNRAADLLSAAGTSYAAIASPAINSFNADLLGLDIPLNFKYQFNPNSNDTYVSAGISSGTYISEAYSSAYNYPNVFGSNSLVQPQEITSRRHFNTFDFAKTLNLSFGMGYPLGKTNRLIVEPFLKYPLGGLGSQNIRFGASGINLKLNFNNNK